MAAPDRFDALRLVALFQTCAATPTDVPIVEFVEGCLEVRKIVALLGAGFSIAGNDIAEKCAVLRARLAELQAAGAARGVAPPLPPGAAADPSDGRVRLTLQFLVASEAAAGTAASNSAAYVSGARSILRLLWLLDFVTALLGGLLQDPSAALPAVARAAYRQTLEPHHGGGRRRRGGGGRGGGWLHRGGRAGVASPRTLEPGTPRPRPLPSPPSPHHTTQASWCATPSTPP